MPPQRLHVDYSERNASLFEFARLGGVFDVQMVRLEIGDYLIDGGVIVEGKIYADFAVSLAGGRLFPRAARLALSLHRPVVLIGGPMPAAFQTFIHTLYGEQSFRSLGDRCRIVVANREY